jgi:hypothetical protein
MPAPAKNDFAFLIKSGGFRYGAISACEYSVFTLNEITGQNDE